MNIWELFGGLGMIIMIVLLGINLVMYFNSYTRSQKNTVIIVAIFNVVSFLAFTGIWVVGIWMSKQQ